MSSKIPRYSLYNFFRLSFFLNGLFSIVVCVFVFYYRSYTNSLKTAITVLTAYNANLSHDLDVSLNTLTNEYFQAASIFASNVLTRAVSFASPTSFVYQASSTNDVSDTALPDLHFHTYFEVNDIPMVYIKRRIYRAGDLLLGYPITEISPDAVEYRGKYFPIEEIQK